MMPPPANANEAARMEAVESLALMYTPAEERFDRITRLATRLLETPIALVTLVSEEKQWFKSSVGLDIAETSRDVSFCGHAIASDSTLVIEDAQADERFADNPLVTGDPNIRFYAGHPIHASDGSRVGTVCVIDRRTRTFTEQDRAALRDLAAICENEIARAQVNDAHRDLMAQFDELQRKASIDGLTRIWNRDAITALTKLEFSRALRGLPVSLAVIDVDHFKTVNDRHGHQTGDKALKQVAQSIRSGIRDFDSVGRYGGDEFVAVLSNCDAKSAIEVCERIRSNVEQATIATPGGALSITVTIGVATHRESFTGVDDLVAAADAALYRAKNAGRNRIAGDAD